MGYRRRNKEIKVKAVIYPELEYIIEVLIEYC